jgi:putative acetyltransferase
MPHAAFLSTSKSASAKHSNAMAKTQTIQIRRERPGDEPAIAHVNNQAFGQPDEARIIDAIRQAGHATISLVALLDQTIVGHILFTPLTIDSPGSAALGLGPMAVLPQFQRQGIGSMLVQAGLQECAKTDCQIVVVIGHPEFYPRFGFRPARPLGLQCQFDVPDPVFMVLELTPGALPRHPALVRYLPELGTT